MQCSIVRFWRREWRRALKVWRWLRISGTSNRTMIQNICTSKKADQWFSDNNIIPMKWPAQSPDLNPIEHLWQHLKAKLQQYDIPPKGVHELWDRVAKEWTEIPPETCQKLIESMPRRIQAVLKAKGGHTKY